MNTLDKIERLCSKRVVESLFKSGDSFFRHPYKIIYVANNLQYNRILITVPKRIFKKAVTRNLIKRRIRESYRLNKSSINLDNKLDIIFIYIASEILTYQVINDRLKECLERIGKGS